MSKVNINIESTEPKSKSPSTVAESRNQNPNRLVRWYLVWFVLFCVVLVPLPLWLYPLNCFGGYAFLTGFTGYTCLILLLCMVNASYTMTKLLLHKSKTAKMAGQQNVTKEQAASSLIHVVIMAAYKEPIDVIIKTVDSLQAQTVARQIFFVAGFEERTPEFHEKCAKLRELYGSTFFHIMFSRHPFGVEGEIPGKCSNLNYSAREAVKQLQQLGIDNFENCTNTTCDTDNVFPVDYFELLGQEFLRCDETRRHEAMWQAPIFYNYDLDKRPFFVRVTGIIRMVFMIGMLFPQNIHPMSIYSMSLKLRIKGNFCHPSYHFNEGMDYLTQMIALGKHVPLKLLLCPVISGPTSGVNMEQEIREWARQTWRWAIGTAEVFHFFCVKSRHISFGRAFAYGFAVTHYYGFVMCSMALISLTGFISITSFNVVGICNPSEYLPSNILYYYIPFMGIGFVYVMFAWCFILDAIAVKWLLNIQENVCLARNVLHWLLTIFVLLAYSAVCYYSIAELAFRGKKVCTHGASKKDGLAPSSKV